MAAMEPVQRKPLLTSDRDCGWCREEATRLRKGAETGTSSGELRDSYLRLARGYDRLGDILKSVTDIRRLGSAASDMDGRQQAVEWLHERADRQVARMSREHDDELDARWYREAAKRARGRALGTVDPGLRADYLALAEAYEEQANARDPH
jgi:hypothetical protein